MDLQGKVAVVTGAAGVIGAGISKRLAAEGTKVLLADLGGEKLKRLVADINASGGSALGVEANVGSRESVSRMVQQGLEVFGRIDVLINNAGVIAVAPLVDVKEEDWNRIIDVNLKGAFLCAQAAVPHMIQKKSGRIINISSVAAKRPGPLMCAYAASKHGLIGLTQVWCQELGPYNITANSICPGFIESPMWKEQLSPAFAPLMGVEPTQVVDALSKVNVPLQRPLAPEDVSDAVVYFCRADNVSGQALTVDGGHAMW